MPNKIVGLSCVYGHRNMTMVSARLFLTPLAARASVAFLDTDTYNLEDKRYHLPSNPCVCNKWRRIPASPGARFGFAWCPLWCLAGARRDSPPRQPAQFLEYGGEQPMAQPVQCQLSAYRAGTHIIHRLSRFQSLINQEDDSRSGFIGYGGKKGS